MEKEQTQNQGQAPFVQQFFSMPEVLQKRVLKQLGASAAFVLLTIIMCVYMQSAEYLVIGLLIAAFLAYLGLDIMWSLRSGRLICRKMKVIQCTRILKTDSIDLVMRELSDNDPNGSSIHNFKLTTMKRERKLISRGAIMNVYYRPSNPTEMVAWEIVDFDE